MDNWRAPLWASPVCWQVYGYQTLLAVRQPAQPASPTADEAETAEGTHELKTQTQPTAVTHQPAAATGH